MREIKFRVWDVDQKKFLESSADKPFKGLSISIDGRPRFWSGDDVLLEGRFWPQGMWVLQQYTGLKDKDGREIYEGDILAFSNNDITNRDSIGYVEYCEDRACYRLLGKLTTKIYQHDMHFLDDPVIPPKGYTTTARTCKINPNRMEVIGNIFENPELLDKERPRT